MSQENCPCCPNHCPKDNLSCGRGRAYFSGENTTEEEKTIEQQVIGDLRRCGHLLHHNKDLDTNELLANLNEDELNKLHELLTKINK